MPDTLSLHVLVFSSDDSGMLVAQCLEHDISVHAYNMDDLHYRFQYAIIGRIVVARELEVDPFSGVPRAPEKFWKLFDTAAIIDPEPPVFEETPAYIAELEMRRSSGVIGLT